MAVMVFAAFRACYHSNFCCAPLFSKFLDALHITFVPSFPSGEGWAGGLGEDRGGRTQPLAVSHPWAVKLQRPLFLAAAKKALALLCPPSCSFFRNSIWPHLWTVVALAWLKPHHSTASFGLLPTAASAPSLHLHHALLYPSTRLCCESSGVGRSRVSKIFLLFQCSSSQAGQPPSLPQRGMLRHRAMGRGCNMEVSSAWGPPITTQNGDK